MQATWWNIWWKWKQHGGTGLIFRYPIMFIYESLFTMGTAGTEFLFELLYHYILYAEVTQIMITMTSFPKCKQPDGPGLMLRYPHFVYSWISFYNGNSWTVYHGVSWFILNQFCCINESLFTTWAAEWFLFQLFNSCSYQYDTRPIQGLLTHPTLWYKSIYIPNQNSQLKVFYSNSTFDWTYANDHIFTRS